MWSPLRSGHFTLGKTVRGPKVRLKVFANRNIPTAAENNNRQPNAQTGTLLYGP
jgi:hypothetical protein